MYYLQSRYYDPETGRFINADDVALLGADGTPLSYNLFAYCKNNPVLFEDHKGNFGLVAAVVLTGAVVGGLLGAFSAATTGGNVLESAIEGVLTGAVGAACGLLISNPVVAISCAAIGGMAVDYAPQATTQYIENGYLDSSKIDVGRIKKTGLLTGLGAAIPQFGQPTKYASDAFGTALIWGEGSTLITVADVVTTKINTSRNRNKNSQSAF